MITRIMLVGILLFVCCGCKGQEEERAEPVRIYRFDKDLFRLVESGNDMAVQGEILCDYPEMLEVLGKAVLNMQKTETPGFFERMVNFYSEPTLKGLYRNALSQYDSIADIEQSLGNGFTYLEKNFPSMPLPKVYMHVSGLNQNVLVAEGLLSVSIDKYMGRDYPLYRNFFSDSQREKMQRALIAPDYLAGWLMSEYPFTGKENVLLERMIYEGKIKYLVSKALSRLTPYMLMGYTEESYNWCKKHEGALWKALIERKHLYTPDLLTTNKYFEDTSPTADTPGNLGTWLGWQIVSKYMEETDASPEMLMRNTQAQDILTKSKYKPF